MSKISISKCLKSPDFGNVITIMKGNCHGLITLIFYVLTAIKIQVILIEVGKFVSGLGPAGNSKAQDFGTNIESSLGPTQH